MVDGMVAVGGAGSVAVGVYRRRIAGVDDLVNLVHLMKEGNPCRPERRVQARRLYPVRSRRICRRM